MSSRGISNTSNSQSHSNIFSLPDKILQAHLSNSTKSIPNLYFFLIFNPPPIYPTLYKIQMHIHFPFLLLFLYFFCLNFESNLTFSDVYLLFNTVNKNDIQSYSNSKYVCNVKAISHQIIFLCQNSDARTFCTKLCALKKVYFLEQPQGVKIQKHRTYYSLCWLFVFFYEHIQFVYFYSFAKAYEIHIFFTNTHNS